MIRRAAAKVPSSVQYNIATDAGGGGGGGGGKWAHRH